jgi:hypothetical protein
MQLLAGIQRPIPVVQANSNQYVDHFSLCIKTVKLVFVLMKRADMNLFSRSVFEVSISKRRLALTSALFMLIRASKMNVSGIIVEKALNSLEKLSFLGLWGLGQLVSGAWGLENVFTILDNAIKFKTFVEWRLSANGQTRPFKPLDAYIAHLLKNPPQKIINNYNIVEEQIDEIDNTELNNR